jgi:hypothetical protein
MSTKNDGGPAFPRYSEDPWKRGTITGGMALRDWFAGQALSQARDQLFEAEIVAMFGPRAQNIRREEIIAADAYAIADAMLKAREA